MSKIGKFVKTCQNRNKNVKIVILFSLKIVKKIKNCKSVGQVMFPYFFDQMSQRSLCSVLKTKGVWVAVWLTRWQGHLLSCQTLVWTAEKADDKNLKICYETDKRKYFLSNRRLLALLRRLGLKVSIEGETAGHLNPDWNNFELSNSQHVPDKNLSF